jgi:ABC-type sugar transport system substrate-binding protein
MVGIGGAPERWQRALLIGVVVAVVSAACGSSSTPGTSSSGMSADALAQVKALYQAESGPSQFNSALPAFDATKAKGKKVWWVSNLGSNSFTPLVYNPFKEALTAAGVQVTFFDGQGSAQEEIHGMLNAIAAKADLIVDQDFPVAQTQAGFDAAKKAGIPVLEWANNDEGAGPTPNGGAGEVTYAYKNSGVLMADAIMALSNGKPVNAVFITTSDVQPAVDVGNGLTSEFQKYCPTACKVTTKDVVIADWSTKLAVTASTSVADPSVNWIVPAFDPETAFVDPAIIQAGAASRVKVCAYNATKGNVDRLKQAGDPLTCDVGSPLGWSGYAIADDALRILSGVKPICAAPPPCGEGEKIPQRIFDRTNIQQYDLNASDATWYGPTDYKAAYRKLWGLSS